MSDTVILSAARAGTVKIGDIAVNRMGFGAMRITGQGIWGLPSDKAAAIAVLQHAVELGINFIDTADAYGPAVSEDLIHEALAPYNNVVIATKGGMTRGGPGQWSQDGRPQHLREACEASLKRLGVDQISVYQLHSPDPNVPFTESVKALADLKNEGKIRHIGLSNVSLEQLQQAITITPIVSVQNHYNLEHRKDSETVLQYCESNEIAFIPYFPIAGNREGGVSAAKMQAIADKHHASPRQIALVWLLQHSPVILPIPGTGSIEHLESNVAAATITLDDGDMATLDNLSD